MTHILQLSLYLIITILINETLHQEVHKIFLHENKYNLNIQVEFQDNNTLLQVRLDMSTPYTYFGDSLYSDSFGGKKLNSQLIFLNNQQFLADEYTQAFQFSFTSFPYFIQHFTYWVLPNKEQNIIVNSAFSLSKHYLNANENNNDFSFVQLLYKQKQIPQPRFAFIYFLHHNPIWYLGGVDRDVNEVFPNTLKLVTDNRWPNHWGLKLKKINNYRNTDFAYFDCNIPLLLSPPSFMKYWNDTFLTPHFKTSKCVVNEKNNILCDQDVKNTFPVLTISFEGYEFSLSGEDLFDDSHIKYKLLIHENTENKWVFGVVFMNKYNMEFNYEDSSITFYTSDEIKFKEDYLSLITYLFYSVFFVLSIGITVNTVYNINKSS